MTQRILVATHNQGKVRELARLLAALELDWLTLNDLGVTLEVAETGETFLENATLKATQYAAVAGCLTLADDSGLEVDGLDGRPGVHTAYYGGPGLTPAERYHLLLENLRGVPWERRTARFRCVMVVANPAGELLATAAGVCEGLIALEPSGAGGFGYDPIFYLPEHGATMAELPPELKNQISHRGRAIQKLIGTDWFRKS
jgi:XTP/dITP diphosphohydrolase